MTFKNSNLSDNQAASNTLFIRIQPDAGVFLKAMTKAPTLNENIAPVLFGYNTDSFFKMSSPEAYEKIFYDSIIGDHSLFVTMQEQLATWDLLTPILDYWNSHPEAMETYEAGSWGSSSADKMLEEQGHQWYLLENENLQLGE